MPEPITVIVTPRDRFSTVAHCLNNILKHSYRQIDVIAVLGGAAEHVRQSLEARFGGNARFIFPPTFMNTAQLRNIGLRLAKTRLAVCLDTDVYVRPGWLEPLVACQEETGASLIVPLVLDRQNLIHTAGNDLYITTQNGVSYGRAELRYAHMTVCETTNLRRRETDFGEIHCHLLEVDTALKLKVYDERLREGSDFDSGLTLRKHGKLRIFEPSSRVYLYNPERISHPDDIGIYIWKWDLDAIIDGFEYFKQKWGIDMVSKSDMRNHIIRLNNKVGFFTRRNPQSRLSIEMDKFYYDSKQSFGQLLSNVTTVKDRLKFKRVDQEADVLSAN